MCGFLGEYTFNQPLTQHEKFSELLSLSKHRGPDSTGFSKGEFYQLGFNRLALLDLTATGEQPKESPNQRFNLVFNGEIYNYKELALKYKINNLRSSSDTEVILHLFEVIGVIKTLKELNGMFAIAVIDKQIQQLYLSRDFAGIKPLFFGITDKGVVFASQFDQIFNHEWFKSSLELRASIVAEYFAFGYMQAPNTIYKNIFQVNPGECLIFDNTKKQTKIDILKFSKTFSSKLKFKYKEGLKQKLNHAITLQLNADRSLASFLSGGIDSSLVTATAKLQKGDIEAFTIQVSDKHLNEAEFAKKYAKHLNLKHQVKNISEENMLKQVDEHFTSFAEPFGDYSSLPTYAITKEASNYHTAMLSGDGGDELFFGYPRMFDLLRRKNWFKLNYHIRTNLVRITNTLSITNTYAPFKDSFAQLWMERHMKLPVSLLDITFSSTSFSIEMRELYNINPKLTKDQAQHFLRWNEFYAHLQRILIKVDRTSMKNSLEVRVPFLDKELIEYAWENMQDISKIENLKQPLKDLVYQYIPKKLMLQSKKGFSVPLKEWLRTSLKADVEKTVCETPFYGAAHFNTKPLISFVNDFLANKHNNEWGVWHIYAWQKWAIQQNLVN
jgi:asparagine synthase (glutamine-hydrolysing)